MPLKDAGTMIELWDACEGRGGAAAVCGRSYPAWSVPTPRALPCMAMSAPSPPEEPPAVRLLLRGLVVRPKTRFIVSSHYDASGRWLVYHIYIDFEEERTSRVWGTFVFTYGIAPAWSRSSTIELSCSAVRPTKEV